MAIVLTPPADASDTKHQSANWSIVESANVWQIVVSSSEERKMFPVSTINVRLSRNRRCSSTSVAVPTQRMTPPSALSSGWARVKNQR